MTIIEFFEKDAMENICSGLLLAPEYAVERIVLIGDCKTEYMQKQAERYKSIFGARGFDVEFPEPIRINRNGIRSIINVLSELVVKYGDCVIDLTGGDDLFLVAAGIVSERYKDRNVQMHRVNIRDCKVIDVDKGGEVVTVGAAPKLTIDELVGLYGGCVAYSDVKKDGTFRWDMNDGFKADVCKIWDICRRKPGRWNFVINAFDKKLADEEKGDGVLSVSLAKNKIEAYIAENSRRKDNAAINDYSDFVGSEVLGGLKKSGLVNLSDTGEELTVTYKDEQVKRCLIKAGQALEMKVYLIALEADGANGEKVYSDALNGVRIDWDGEIHNGDGGSEVDNEIDVVMMHGMIPVFVSCKNGNFGAEELYKFNTVVSRFGGKYAKKVLIASALGGSAEAESVRQRADDMNITLIEYNGKEGEKRRRFIELGDDEMKRVIGDFYKVGVNYH